MINYQELKYFECVARHEHFTRAANELFVSQSTLSKAIDNLEREIGVKLFEKKGRNVQLTVYGRVLRDYVERGCKEMDAGVKLIMSMTDPDFGKVRIATIFSEGSFRLPQYIKGFSDEHPNIRIRYYQKSTYQILQDLTTGKLDLGFCCNYEETEETRGLNRELLQTDELCLIVPENHPMADRESVDFAELVGENWVGYNSDTGMSTAILDVMEAAGYDRKLKFSYYASEDSAIIGLVRAGLGISVLPAETNYRLDGVKKIRLSRPYFYRNIYMVWNGDQFMSPAAQNFRKYILKRI